MEDIAAREEGRSQEESPVTYCVTGASGYIGSWLVKSLLQRGYLVHATVRSPEKSLNLLKEWDGGERLRIFKADLQEDGSFDAAVRGCSGLFHVAASMQFEVPVEENVDSYVQTNVIEPAIKGTLNVLKACSRTNSVRRVVFTSSISTMTAKDSSENWRDLVDESCKVPINRVWKHKPTGWVYALTKILTEEAAFQFAHENGIDLRSVITATVAGPFLTSTVPTSIRVLLSPITGDPQLLPILVGVNSRMGSIALVHIEDICNAHIFVMEDARAEGRYMCCSRSCGMAELVDYLMEEYPCSNLQRLVKAKNESIPAEISSKKLTDLGFNFKYDVQDIIQQAVEKCIACGFLPGLLN
ncbi:putative anthocyanidin reductase [Coffea arabica]|uniref:Anthocyanidin reductase n=1 Tax=Coffea arabica TaxID=13443 RepID=A0ABM4UDK0_COFAR